MVFYDEMVEAWVYHPRGGREMILADMTLEDAEDIDMTFETEEDFWEWYENP